MLSFVPTYILYMQTYTTHTYNWVYGVFEEWPIDVYLFWNSNGFGVRGITARI